MLVVVCGNLFDGFRGEGVYSDGDRALMTKKDRYARAKAAAVDFACGLGVGVLLLANWHASWSLRQALVYVFSVGLLSMLLGRRLWRRVARGVPRYPFSASEEGCVQDVDAKKEHGPKIG